MDPASVTAHVVREVARDGNFGAHAHDVWAFASQVALQPIDDALKDSVWLWIAQHPAIRVDGDRVYASEELQWLELTGGPRQGNVVPQLAFNVLCTVAHSRETGVSTVEVARKVGQDPRSLFGRVQLLADLGLVQRFPVIEKGSSTHRIVLSPYADQHARGEAEGDPFVDKQLARRRIVEFCSAGPQGLRLKRDVVHQIGPQLTANAQRRRPLVISLLKDLELQGCVRSMQMFDPEMPTKAYACVQFVKDYELAGRERRSNIAWTDTSVVPLEEGDPEEPTAEDGDYPGTNVDNESSRTADWGAQPLDLSRAVVEDVSRSAPQANSVLPLVNQIHDAVFRAGAQGVSAMDLTRNLTGKAYSKSLGKYLEALTNTAKSKSSKATQPAELGHLTLIKGVDFSHRVKYYRYFTRMTYPTGITDAIWGSFSRAPAVRDPQLSLKVIDARSRVPLPGGCLIMETEDGMIRPVFHGEKTAQGKVLLTSDPSRSPGAPTVSTKRRGRPPKNAPREPDMPKSLPPKKEPTVNSVRLNDRLWEGGTKVEQAGSVAIWLRRPDQPPPQEEQSLDSSHVLTGAPSNSGKSTPRKQSTSEKTPAVLSAETLPATNESLGSLAFTRRTKTLLAIVRENKGAVVGGQDLVDRFNAAAEGDALVDRKTIDRVIRKLVKEGILRQIFVNVPTMTGIHLMKYVLYDPVIVQDAESSEVIAALKQELGDRTRQKQAVAAKAAASANKSINDSGHRQQMTSDQAKAFRPILGQRLATTASRKKPLYLRRFGASAAEVTGVSAQGEPIAKGAKRAKRASANHTEPEAEVPAHYGAGPVTLQPRPQPSPAHKVAPRQKSTTPQELAIDPDWLFRAVIVVRTLFPRGKGVDWTLISAALPAKMSERALKQRWTTVRDSFSGGKAEVTRRSIEWEDLVVEAYAADELLYLKPSDAGFTLEYYIQWWRVADESRVFSRAQRADRDKRSLRDLKYVTQNVDSRLVDPLSSLQAQPSMIRAEELLVKTLLGESLENKQFAWKHPFNLSDNAARLRAVIAADDGAAFSAQDAVQDLQGLSEEDAKMAFNELERQKYVQWAASDPEKVPAGRPYVLSEKVMNMLAPPAKLDRELPRKATQAMSDMPTNETFDVSETIDESQMIPLLEMAAFGLNGKYVVLHRTGERSGRLSTHYRSRDIDKGELDCHIKANVQALGAQMPRHHALTAPVPEYATHPYIWHTSHLESKKIWGAIVYKLLITVLFRPGITQEALVYSLRHVLEKEEVTQAINALVAVDALSIVGGGLRTTPAWFSYAP